jgi:CRP-like cAMP-binding protein
MNTNNIDATVRQHWQKYLHLWHFMEAPAKTTLLEEGTVARKLYRIIKGAARGWFNHDGKEISFQFFFEGDTVSSIESFRKGVPSAFSIETIEPCELHWMYKTDLDFVIQDDVFLRRRMMDWTVDRQAEFIKHLFSFLKDSPQQRYENLLKEKPEIIQRVPLQYIASYLGITPVSLSRIRNKV